jgi:hypothetical protein
MLTLTSSAPLNHFDRGKPFYPLIMNYLILLIGFKELGGRGVIKELNKSYHEKLSINLDKLIIAHLKELPASELDKTRRDQQISDISNNLSNLLGPLKIKSEFQDNYIIAELDEIANDLFNNASYLLRFTMLSAGSLLILAYEISKDKKYIDNGPLWEFLRHCRNAAAHGGVFNFQGNEPKRPAEWGRFRIEAIMHGKPLFKDVEGRGFLSPGDPIRLLWDIEQAYPNMSA